MHPAVSALENVIRWENGLGGSGGSERIFFLFFA
jgi:hypothetical protein